MNKLNSRLRRLEDRMAQHSQTGSRQLTVEQVEKAKALCLAFLKHFAKPNPLNWKQEPESDEPQKLSHIWLKNTAIILALLARHPDLVENVQAVPELHALTRLVHAGSVVLN